MSYIPNIPSESNAIASLYTLHFYGVNAKISPLTVMDSFYARITPLKFQSAKEASSYCRQLAREYGFTMKQETSSNRNIYIYCSREGIADSSKQTKRKRSSIKCDCKWRIVLFRKESSQWEFRKSNNPQHAEHNHDLIPPENIPAPWPSNVLQKIAEYASSGFPTGDIRQLMQKEFPNLPWDERRFYNRLAEERKKIKVRETEKRVVETIVLAARVASLACSSHEYTNKVKTVLQQAFDDICESANIDSASVISSSQDNMTTISLPTSSTADIVCNYPAGSITVKNIPAQKGRPSKKNIHPKPQLQFEQQLQDIRDTNHKSQNAPQQPETSTHLQHQTEFSTHLQSQSEFELIQRQNQFYSSQSQVQIRPQQQMQEELCQPFQISPISQYNSNELNTSFLLQTQPQPILQSQISQINFYSPDEQFQKQEQFCSQPHIQFVPPINSYSRNNNQPLMSQGCLKMKFDPHMHFQNQSFEQINKYEKQILDSQLQPQLCSSQIQESTNFAKRSLTTQTIQEILLSSYPQVFTKAQEKK